MPKISISNTQETQNHTAVRRIESITMESQDLYEQVNKRYGSMNKSKTGQYEKTVATAFGYSEDELSGIPEGANLGLSCGNPQALAKLQEVRADFLLSLGITILITSRERR